MHLSTKNKIRIAKLALHSICIVRTAFGLKMQGVFNRTNGLYWQLDLKEGIDFAIFLLGAFERDLIKFYEERIQPSSTILDLGANIGAHTLPLARKVGPLGKVVAIEATEFAYAKLNANLALNPSLAPAVIPLHALLVETPGAPGDAEIASSWPLTGDESAKSALSGALKKTGAAPRLTVDQVVSNLALAKVDWIKLDVDGHELTVLLGARQTLAKYHPRILMELAPYCHAYNPGQFETLIQLLHDAGYTLKTIPHCRILPQTAQEIEVLIPKFGSINIFAEPQADPALNRTCHKDGISL